MLKVHCYNLNHNLDDANVNHVNYLSIDAEGGEFEILQNLDFLKFQIDVISVEGNYKNHEFRAFL